MKRFVAVVPSLIQVLGAVAITVGVATLSVTAAWILTGVFLLLFGVSLELPRRK